jgi:hypothetical protein
MVPIGGKNDPFVKSQTLRTPFQIFVDGAYFTEARTWLLLYFGILSIRSRLVEFRTKLSRWYT